MTRPLDLARARMDRAREHFDGVAEAVYRPEMSGRVDSSQDDDLQFSLTPDDSLVLHNRVDRQEIYAYEIH